MDLTNEQWKKIKKYVPKPRAPHKNNRVKSTTQDGRALRRFRNRWKVERFFACLQSFRRLVVRYEHHLKNSLAMAQLGCIVILLRKALR